MFKEAVIIDYGMGNVGSVQKALNFLSVPNTISNNFNDIMNASYLILPGVGSFKQGMSNLSDLNLIQILTNEVIVNKKPFLGICLGMQLIATKGTEPEHCDGLNWINGKVIKIQEDNMSIPHLGWNNIQTKKECFSDFNDKDFYFIHSYHFEVSNEQTILASVNYGNRDYVAAILNENIMATQFHPEKSQEWGLKALHFFFDYYA